MKVKSNLLQFFHLDKTYSLMSGKNVKMLLDLFQMLDIHQSETLNDIQFFHFMKHITDLGRDDIYVVFDMLDVDGSGEIDFDEFYLLMCILIAVKDNQEKQFIYRHSRTVFDLLDEDGSNSISTHEFETFGFLLNLQGAAVKKIFNEFDVSGDSELDYKEFRMFAMACIDKQNELEKQRLKKLEEKRQKAYFKKQKKRGRRVGVMGAAPKMEPIPGSSSAEFAAGLPPVPEHLQNVSLSALKVPTEAELDSLDKQQTGNILEKVIGNVNRQSIMGYGRSYPRESLGSVAARDTDGAADGEGRRRCVIL